MDDSVSSLHHWLFCSEYKIQKSENGKDIRLEHCMLYVCIGKAFKHGHSKNTHLVVQHTQIVGMAGKVRAYLTCD